MSTIKEAILQMGGCERLAVAVEQHLDKLAPFTIIRVWTDPKRQKELIDRWDSGDREGLRCRPADPSKSRHCKVDADGKPASEAVDLHASKDALIKLGSAWVNAGYRWGGNFKVSDPVHFDLG